MQPGLGYGPPVHPQPPQRNRTPLIIGGIAAVVVVGLVTALTIALSGGDDDNTDNTADVKGGDAVETTTSAAPVTGVTYEITGSTPVPLTVVYDGSNGEDVETTVSSLPWSATVDPAPDFVGFFALETSIDGEADITLTLKQGDEVIRTCEGGGPCMSEVPS